METNLVSAYVGRLRRDFTNLFPLQGMETFNAGIQRSSLNCFTNLFPLQGMETVFESYFFVSN